MTDNRHAGLLFNIVSSRSQQNSTIITTRPVRVLAMPHPADQVPAHGRSRGRQARSRRSAGMVRLRRARRRPTGRGIPSASGRPPFSLQHQRWKTSWPEVGNDIDIRLRPSANRVAGRGAVARSPGAFRPGLAAGGVGCNAPSAAGAGSSVC